MTAQHQTLSHVFSSNLSPVSICCTPVNGCAHIHTLEPLNIECRLVLQRWPDCLAKEADQGVMLDALQWWSAERELHMHWSLGGKLASIFQLVSEEVHRSNPQWRDQLTFLR